MKCIDKETGLVCEAVGCTCKNLPCLLIQKSNGYTEMIDVEDFEKKYTIVEEEE